MEELLSDPAIFFGLFMITFVCIPTTIVMFYLVWRDKKRDKHKYKYRIHR